MKFQVGDIVLRKGRPSWCRSIVRKTYQDRWGNVRMTTRDIGWGEVVTNCKMDDFVLYPYFPSDTVARRAKEALAPDKAFRIGKETYLALPRWKIPELMARIFITDDLLAEPVSLTRVLKNAGKSYKKYRQEAEAAGRVVVGLTAYVYKLLMPLKDYRSRWW